MGDLLGRSQLRCAAWESKLPLHLFCSPRCRSHAHLLPSCPLWAQDVRLLISVPRLPVAVSEVTPDPIEEALALMMQLRVSLKNAWVKVGVRVTMRPLLRRLPVVGALQVGRMKQGGYRRCSRRGVGWHDDGCRPNLGLACHAACTRPCRYSALHALSRAPSWATLQTHKTCL